MKKACVQQYTIQNESSKAKIKTGNYNPEFSKYKKPLLYGLAGLLVGVVLVFVILFYSAQSIMLKEKESKHSYERTVELLVESAAANGWQIPTIHDMKATMDSFGKDVLNGKVFELCHPEHAYEILSRDNERIVMSMMPCRIAVYEKSDEKTYISWMNTGLMGKMMKGVVPSVMKVASRESKEIIAPLIK